MVREKQLFLVRLMKITDAVVILFSFVAAFFITSVVRSYIGSLGPLAYAPSFSMQGALFF